jgi:hypothetical protein
VFDVDAIVETLDAGKETLTAVRLARRGGQALRKK